MATLIFWDFDGVIKDSVDVKTQAFVKLFERYGSQVSEQVKSHHEAHGGMSRFEKIPLYLMWAGERVTPDRIDEYCQRFAQMVRQGVIDAPWVPGAEALLRNNPHRQIFVLVSATPQEELEQILYELDLMKCFASVIGAPTSKAEAIRMTLNRHNIDPQHCLMIGDARADMEAAQANQVPFLLRRHTSNQIVFGAYNGASIKDLREI